MEVNYLKIYLKKNTARKHTKMLAVVLSGRCDSGEILNHLCTLLKKIKGELF